MSHLNLFCFFNLIFGSLFFSLTVFFIYKTLDKFKKLELRVTDFTQDFKFFCFKCGAYVCKFKTVKYEATTFIDIRHLPFNDERIFCLKCAPNYDIVKVHGSQKKYYKKTEAEISEVNI